MFAARCVSRLEGVVIATSLVAGLAFALLFPPFVVSDEPGHFLRAWTVSTGMLGTVRSAEGVGAPLPPILERQIDRLWTGVPLDATRKVARAEIAAALREPLPAEPPRFAVFPTSAQFTFVPYVPQALGIAAARVAGATPLATAYAGRLANLIAGTLLVVAAVRRLPAGRELMALVALAPMALTLRASLSADTTTIGLAFLCVAATARLAWGSCRAPACELAVAVVSGLLLCLTKATYAPVALAPLVIPAARLPRGGRRWLAAYVVLVIACVVVALWIAAAAGPLRPGISDIGTQLRLLVDDPLRVLGVVLGDALGHGPGYAAQLVGIQLGWLDVRLPPVPVLAFLALFGVTLAVGDPGAEGVPGVTQRVVLATLAVVSAFLVVLAIYLSWTPPGADHVIGVQGRYFLPLLPLGVLAVMPARASLSRGAQRALLLALAATTAWLLVVAMLAIEERYYG